MAVETPVFVPSEFRAYDNLSPDEKAKVQSIVDAHLYKPGEAGGAPSDPAKVKESILASLSQFGSEGELILVLVGNLLRGGLVKHGLYDAIVNVLGVKPVGEKKAKSPAPPAADGAPTPAPKAKAKKAIPFKIPEPKQTREVFMAEWIAENEKARKYPADMIDLSTGEINWSAKSVYTYEPGTVSFLVFQALQQGPQTYETLSMLMFNGKPLADEKKSLDKALKGLAVEPSWTPPGAGRFLADDETGLLWISREPADVADTIPWMNF